MLSVGIIGCGSIGSFVARSIVEGQCGAGVEVACVFDADLAKAQALSASLRFPSAASLASASNSPASFSSSLPQGKPPKVAESLGELLACKPALVVEAAAQAAVHECGEKILLSGSSLLIMSVGALLDEKMRASLKQAEKKGKATLLVPSGAIGGLDALRSASIGRVDSVVLTTRKPAASLGFAGLKAEKLVFDGVAREAVKKFPFNVNVAAALSLAGIGADKTSVKIIADPSAKTNVHEIEVKGEFGTFFARFENEPSKQNAKTSALAAFSAVAQVTEFAEANRVSR